MFRQLFFVFLFHLEYFTVLLLFLLNCDCFIRIIYFLFFFFLVLLFYDLDLFFSRTNIFLFLQFLHLLLWNNFSSTIVHWCFNICMVKNHVRENNLILVTVQFSIQIVCHCTVHLSYSMYYKISTINKLANEEFAHLIIFSTVQF